jgi:hypothetical protein
MDPQFVPEEKIIFIQEPDVLLPGGALFLRAEDIVHDSLPGLRYLVHIRIVEFQDWNSQPTSVDEDYRRDDSEHDGSDDSNHNRRHPGLDQGGDGYRGPRTVRCAGATDADPRLGGRCGTSFMPRRTVIIGTIACPVSDGGRVVVGTYNRPVMGHLSGRAEADELRGLNIQAPASARLPSDDTPMICDDASCDDVIFN